VNRSSTSRTGIGTRRPARAPANVRAAAAAAPSRPDRLVGKPTINHVEGCPALDGTSCKPLTTYLDWGIKGYEEAVAIHGVFSELQVDGVVPDLPERTAAQ